MCVCVFVCVCVCVGVGVSLYIIRGSILGVVVSGFSLEGGVTKYSVEVAAQCIVGGAFVIENIHSVDDAAATLLAGALRASRSIQRFTVANGA